MTTTTALRTTVLTAAAACAALLALAGCAQDTPRATDTTPASPTHRSTPTAASVRSTPTPTATATATPTVPLSSPTPTTAPTAVAAPPTPSLAEHVRDVCSVEAARDGVTLVPSDTVSGRTTQDGRYEVVLPFTFDDGHQDPYAVYVCTVTDDTLASTLVGAGPIDTH